MTASSLPGPDASTPATAAGSATLTCAACGASLAATARFCHHCGTPVGAAAVAIDQASTQAVRLPWLLGGAALVGVAAFLYARQPTESEAAAGAAANPMSVPAAPGGGPPNIANMTPSERANRLYGRVMAYAEAGKGDSAAFFAPMALAAHEMLDNATLDERYHMGRIAEIVGRAGVTKAQADTILQLQGDNLLGLLLAARAARMNGDAQAAKTFDQKLLRVLDAQMATKLPEYEMHRMEIERAADDARRD